MTSSLSGKAAFVTGGSRGIGAAIARRLAGEGAAVAVTYTKGKDRADELVKSLEAQNSRAIALQADSANAEAVQSAIRETVKTFGRLDILVNNAGLALMGTIDTFSLDDFDRLVAVNIRGVFVAVQEAVRYLPEGGRIINIGSCNAERMPFPGMGPYGMTKAAIATLTQGLARDLGPRGITVNTIQPGPVDTDMNPADGPMAASLTGLMAIQRHGHAEEIASLAAYLAGPESAFITGASLTVDGGFNC